MERVTYKFLQLFSSKNALFDCLPYQNSAAATPGKLCAESPPQLSSWPPGRFSRQSIKDSWNTECPLSGCVLSEEVCGSLLMSGSDLFCHHLRNIFIFIKSLKKVSEWKAVCVIIISRSESTE